MPKYTFTEIDNVNSPSAASTINANFQELQDLIDLLLSRDGTLPNTMSADLDLNGFRLLNAQNVDTEGSGGDMLTATYDPSGIAAQIVGLSAVQTLTNKTIDPSLNTIDGDKLDIDFTPSNYTPDASPAEASDVDDLAAHLKGIDSALTSSGNMSTLVYDPAGITQQVLGTTATQTLFNKTIDLATCNLDGDKITIDFTPANYTPDDSPAEAGDVDDLSAHLKGIDTALIGGGGLSLATYDPAGIGEQLVGLTASQTLTNKTINPALNGIDGDKLDIDFTPTNYTPDMPLEADDLDDLAAHLKGIDDALSTEFINDATFATATASNYNSAEATKNYIDTSGVIPAGTQIMATRDSAGDLQTPGDAPDGTFVIDADGQPRSIAILAADTFVETAVTASRELTDADASDLLNTTSGQPTNRARQVLRPLHGTPSTAIALSVPANLAHGTIILVRVPGNQTGAVTLDLVGAGAINGDTSAVTIPAKRLFTIYCSNVAGNAPTIETSLTVEDSATSNVDETGSTVSLTFKDHNNAHVQADDDVTIPTTTGMGGTIIATGSLNVLFNSTTVTAMTTGQILSYIVRSATVIDATLADRLVPV